MCLLAKLSKPFFSRLVQDPEEHTKLFRLGEEIGQLERKRKQLYERLGDEVYHGRIETASLTTEELQQVELEIRKKSDEMRKLDEERGA